MDIPQTYHSMSMTLCNNMELIPEFFFGEGSFLLNSSNARLGLTPANKPVSDATLPPWASSVQMFTLLNRQALESNQSSTHLHSWLALLFGDKQGGGPGLRATNLYQPYCYRRGVDFSRCACRLERRALERQVFAFGQLPVERGLVFGLGRMHRSFSLAHQDEAESEALRQAKAEIARLRVELQAAQEAIEGALNKQFDDFKVVD